jgi:hypothetical protein
MNFRFLVVSTLSLAILSPLAGAQTPDQAKYLQLLEGKSSNMRQCAAIASQLEKMPVPPGHNDAKQQASANNLMGNKAAPVAIDPVHANFANQATAMDRQLEACGKQLFTGLEAIEANLKPFIETLKKQAMKDDEKKKVSQVLGGFMQSKQELQSAISLLSKDREMQIYVKETLASTFLNKKY